MGSVANEKKVAIITGSTSGIGHMLAQHLHAKGWRVAVSGRREAEGTAIASALDASGETAIFVQCDIASYASQTALFRAVWARWGRLDLLVANAGGVDRSSVYNFSRRGASVDDVPPEPDFGCTDVDLKGVMHGTVLATHFMRHNEPAAGGKIVVTGSMIGVHPCATFPEYCAAKAGVHHWCRTTAPLLWNKEGITINCVMPAGVDTPAMPGFSTAFLFEEMTMPKTLLSAYDLFIDDEENKRNGQCVETAHKNLYFYDVPEIKSGAFGQRTQAVYEPWFALVHGERSGLEDAIKEPPTQPTKETQ